MSTITTRCPSCNGLNKLPVSRISEQAVCGKCKAPLLDGAPIEGTPKNLDALLTSNIPVVVDFWAPWCGPCQSFAPIFKEVAQQRQNEIRFVKVDTESNPELAGQYRIRSIPTLMVFKGGQRVDFLSGALPKSQFESWLNNAIAK
ncbi:thioredoxin TrxC [Vibrio albus]|uniref:Thioredoxin n=1 Tax=Vibrio albus TaxID=2200953 RepID=A0A2U3B5X8_9VIBR|nr:thioredoxin TrxC [Vibrio albus]PWI32206.1 thioredoxin TrxC [Vibrio albus]